MPPADSHCLQRHAFVKTARLDNVQPPAFPPRMQSSKNGREKGSKKVTSVNEPGSKTEVRFKKPRPAQSALRRSPQRVERGRSLSRMPPKRRDPRHCKFEDPVPKKMPLGYEVRRYPAEITVSAVFKRKGSLPPALQDKTLESGGSRPFSLLLSAFIKKKHRMNMFLTVGEINFLQEMAWIRRALQYAREREGEGQNEGSFWQRVVSMYQHTMGAVFFAKKPLKYSNVNRQS